MSRIGIFILFVPLFLFLGCEKPIDRQMVIGRYKANHQEGIDSLELKPNGTYIHNYKSLNGKEVTSTNKWDFEYSESKPMITFHNFTFGLPGYGSNKTDFWLVEVKRSFTGKFRLFIDTDLDYYFEKNK